MIEKVVKCDGCNAEIGERSTGPIPKYPVGVIEINSVATRKDELQIITCTSLHFCGPNCIIAWVNKTWLF